MCVGGRRNRKLIRTNENVGRVTVVGAAGCWKEIVDTGKTEKPDEGD